MSKWGSRLWSLKMIFLWRWRLGYWDWGALKSCWKRKKPEEAIRKHCPECHSTSIEIYDEEDCGTYIDEYWCCNECGTEWMEVNRG